ncbi:MAG: type II toxin-antitoxin system HicA family toxin [Lachnospiraceae bacterium]
MSKKEKLKKKFLEAPKDFTYDELVALLRALGFEEQKPGHSTGSAVLFLHRKKNVPIRFHKPHPGNIIKGYLMKQVKDVLEREGIL